MSNTEGPNEPLSQKDWENQFARPSDVPSGQDEPTSVHEPVGEPTRAHAPIDETTQTHQSAPTQAQPAADSGWAAPAGAYGSHAALGGGGDQAPPNYFDAPAAPQGPKRSGGLGWLKWIATVVVAALVGAIASTALGGNEVYNADRVRSDDRVAEPSQASSQEATPSTIRGVLEAVQPAVVTINVVSAEGEGSGTGMIVSSDGEILTNNHVVTGASRIEVTLDNETEPRQARLLGSDDTIDSALIKIDGISNLPTVEFGDSEASQVGDEVVAIGNALALQGGPSVTSGIISAKDRSITDSTASLTNLIQTDTAINPGNSGGPLVNMAGQVIGVNTAVIRGSSGEYENIGFSMSINAVQPALEDMRNGATNQPAYLGINPVTLDDSIRDRYSLSPDEGAVISQVQAGSPADTAGLSRFDVITDIDGTAITSSDQLVNLVREKSPGDAIEITFYRGDDERTVTATLAGRPTAAAQ